jgi:phospholipase/carboxylesterase
MAFSGFIPTVDTWDPSLTDRTGTRVLIAHGRNDPVIDVEFARRARDTLGDAGLEVDYSESDATHTIDSADVPRAASWLAGTIE